MITADDEINKKEDAPPGEDADILRDFIERKKLENRILQKIIDNLRHIEPENQTHKNNQNKEKP